MHQGILSAHDINVPGSPSRDSPSAAVTLNKRIEPASNHTVESPTEDERRSRLYQSLVRAQRRYAEKLATPTGPDGRYTKEEWESLGADVSIESLEGGFIEDKELHEKKRSFRKENVRPWKGEKKMLDGESDEEDAVHLTMEF